MAVKKCLKKNVPIAIVIATAVIAMIVSVQIAVKSVKM